MLLLLYQNNLYPLAPKPDVVVAKTGGDDAFRHGRFQVEVKDKIHSFDYDYEAQEFIQRLQDKAKQTIKDKKKKALVKSLKVVEIQFEPELILSYPVDNTSYYDEDDDICCLLLLA